MKLNQTRCLIALWMLPLLCLAQSGPAYTISTIAGTGTSGFAGDGGPGASAQLNNPLGILLDANGNLYIADSINSRVRISLADGTITTVAGNGTSAYTGDSGAATSASLNHPTSVVLDSNGNLFIADARNHVIRKVSGSTITTVAGNGISTFNGDGEAATSASLNTPMGLAFDSAGNLYIADSFNHRIRKLGTDGKISTVAGKGTAGSAGDGGKATEAKLNYPQAIAFDAVGNLYIADTSNDRIRKVATDGTITTIAGSYYFGYSGDGGPATQALLNYPKGLALDRAGNLFFADSFNSRIRRIDTNGTIQTIAGTGVFGDRGDGGESASAQLRFPAAVAVDTAGRVYVSDNQNSRIRLLTPVVSPASSPSAPSINVGGVLSSTAFGALTSVAPGSWIEIYGANLAAGEQVWSAADFNANRAPTSLAGVRVTIGGQDAYLAYVSPTQINALVPSTTPLGSQQILVTTAGGTSQPYRITVNQVSPGLFAPPTSNVAGVQYAAAVLADGGVGGAPSRPVRPGESITFYGVGFGPVTPRLDAGEIAQQASALGSPIEIYFGQTPVTPSYAGLAPGSVGLYQFNLVVPAVAGGTVPLTIRLGGAGGEQGLQIAVGN